MTSKKMTFQKETTLTPPQAPSNLTKQDAVLHGTRLFPKGAGEGATGQRGMLVLLLGAPLVGAWVREAGAHPGLDARFPNRLLCC